jgi:hypothetical protein
MARSPFTGSTGRERNHWDVVRGYQIRFNDLFGDGGGATTNLAPTQLLPLYAAKLAECDAALDAIEDAMRELQLDIKNYVESLKLPFALGISGKKNVRTLAIQWRYRTARKGRTWITMADWPEVLGQENMTNELRNWFSLVTSMLVILNTESSMAHSARQIIIKNKIHLEGLTQQAQPEAAAPR